MLQLALIVPTFNEVQNVSSLRDHVAAALEGIEWEMIFVDDDSPDGTAAKAREMAQQDPRVRCVHRIGRRGLASACIEGVLASSAPLIAVIDADHQHDEKLLPQMFEVLHDRDVDVVVGSRYAEHGHVGAWDESRIAVSRLATRLSRLVLKADLHDPMSGFFMMRREAFVACVRAGVSGIGFKILLDLLATSPTPLRCRELPLPVPQPRRRGKQARQQCRLGVFHDAPGQGHRAAWCRSASSPSCWSAALGLGVHLLVLGALFKGAGSSFLWAQGAATMVAMTCNFVLNNLLTYRDRRLRGWRLLQRLVLLRPGLQRRRDRQRRHRGLPVPEGHPLGVLGHRGRSRRRGVELRRDRRLHVEDTQDRIGCGRPRACAGMTRRQRTDRSTTLQSLMDLTWGRAP